MSEQKVNNEIQDIAPEMLVVDCRPIGSILVDLPAGAMVGLQAEHEGLDETLQEIVTNQSTIGERAGVTNSDIQDLKTINGYIDKIDEELPRARKIVELLEESRAKHDHDRHRLIAAIASMVETRARLLQDDSLLARYEKTRTYRSARAIKGAKTRKRNAAAAQDEATDPSTPSV